jgi:RNA 2',3'-cyclic 3'-phosphodiesterase
MNTQNESGEIRCFIAIELPEQVKRFLDTTSSDLKKCGADVKWVRSSGIHLTLKFLGNVKIELIPVIDQRVRPIFARQSRIDVHVSGLGAFPSLGRPRVIWAGLQVSGNALSNLVRQLEQELELIGFNAEKRAFSPHLTLGRVRSGKGGADLIQAVRQRMDMAGPTFEADHAVLFKSVLKPSGAEYFAISRFNFLST